MQKTIVHEYFVQLDQKSPMHKRCSQDTYSFDKDLGPKAVDWWKSIESWWCVRQWSDEWKERWPSGFWIKSQISSWKGRADSSSLFASIFYAIIPGFLHFGKWAAISARSAFPKQEEHDTAG